MRRPARSKDGGFLSDVEAFALVGPFLLVHGHATPQIDGVLVPIPGGVVLDNLNDFPTVGRQFVELIGRRKSCARDHPVFVHRLYFHFGWALHWFPARPFGIWTASSHNSWGY